MTQPIHKEEWEESIRKAHFIFHEETGLEISIDIASAISQINAKVRQQLKEEIVKDLEEMMINSESELGRERDNTIRQAIQKIKDK